MTIRASFQPAVDEFIANLEEFATGSYLRADEREFWDQPFDPAVLPKLRAILEGFLDTLDALEAPVVPEAINEAVTAVINDIDAFNSKNADAVVEPEEKAELNELIRNAVARVDSESDVLDNIPELE
ncbi:hypothetical protein [Corynebacterium epidermidicanis]|uniref:Uncharacterized protein n=1 Tax=Corynebacterium epidermidicanis TaxID=1050174 RepID=A0A0G3GWF7_9CORY|nr:hypothetical protein [Corynebacterium epidermidicanis]AKK03157.1 hypothetical protein CEPID_06490 [Corynebacterium epidermidicanis]